LIAAGEDVNQVDATNKETPLIIASKGDRAASVHLLIGYGANINAIDSSGKSSLTWSAQRGHLRVVELLIAHGAKVDHVDSSRRTPLSHAVAIGYRAEIVRALILAGADATVIQNDESRIDYLEPILQPLRLIAEYTQMTTGNTFDEFLSSLEYSGISAIQGLIGFAYEAKKSGRDVLVEPDMLQFLKDREWDDARREILRSIIQQLVLLKCTDLSVIYIVAPFLDSSNYDTIKRFEIGLRFLTNSVKDLMSTTGSVDRQSLVEYTGPILNAMIHRASPLGLRPVVKALYTMYWKTYEAQLSLRGLRAPETLHTIIHSYDKGPLGIYTDLKARAMARLGVAIRRHYKVLSISIYN